jgi:hypothetical protein
MSPLLSAEVLAGTLILLALAVLAFIFTRRRLLASGSPLVLCALRRRPQAPYRLGLLRFSGTCLEWFSLVGPSLRPGQAWDRVRLQLEAPSVPHTVLSGLPDAVEVACHHGADEFSLALAPGSYTAMRSWLESAPPGHNVNVA